MLAAIFTLAGEKKHPPSPLPKYLESTHNPIESARMQKSPGENMVLVNDVVQSIIAFGTTKNLISKYFSNYLRAWNFYSMPQIFHSAFHLCLVSKTEFKLLKILIFRLLPNKTADNYNVTFILIKRKYANLDEMFKPSKVVVNLEVAIHVVIKNSVVECHRDVSPALINKGCTTRTVYATVQGWEHRSSFVCKKDVISIYGKHPQMTSS